MLSNCDQLFSYSSVLRLLFSYLAILYFLFFPSVFSVIMTFSKPASDIFLWILRKVNSTKLVSVILSTFLYPQTIFNKSFFVKGVSLLYKQEISEVSNSVNFIEDN